MNYTINDTLYDVIIERKNNKNLYIRVTDDMKIKVTCNRLYTKLMIKKVLDQNNKSLIRMINNQKKKNVNKIKEKYMLLGNPITVLYEDVKRAKDNGNIIIVKDDKMLDNWYKKKAKEIFQVYIDEAYNVFDEDIPYPKLKVRTMKTRWGVCNKRDNSVTLNLELIKKDHKYLNYVIVHELSHFVHFNHSKAFWNTVEKYCPEYKLVRKELKE